MCGVVLELLFACTRAKIIIIAVVGSVTGGVLFVDFHVADGIDGHVRFSLVSGMSRRMEMSPLRSWNCF